MIDGRAPQVRLTDCPGVDPDIPVSCGLIPYGCTRPRDCWNASDSDNDGLDDLTEVFGTVTATDKDPRFGPNLFEPGSIERRGLFAPKLGPAHVKSWSLDVSRIAPVSATKYDVLVEVQGMSSEGTGDHEHQLTLPTVQALEHTFEVEPRECAFEPVLCDPMPLGDSCCNNEVYLYGIDLHVFIKRPRVLSSYANHANYNRFNGFGGEAQASFNSGGLDDLMEERGLDYFGSTPERRFTSTFRFAFMRPEVKAVSEYGVYHAGQAFGIPGRALEVRDDNSKTLAHELGHLLGLHHNGYNAFGPTPATSMGSAFNPVYPSLMNYFNVGRAPVKGDSCLGAGACACTDHRFSRGHFPGGQFLPARLSTTSNDYFIPHWLQYLSCSFSFGAIVGCTSPTECNSAAPDCSCDPLQPSCNCSDTETTCSLDWTDCSAPEFTEGCDGPDGCPAFMTDYTGTIGVDPGSLAYLEWTCPESPFHVLADDNDWERMYAYGKFGLRPQAYSEYAIAVLPFNDPDGSEVGATVPEPVDDVGGLNTFPLGSNLTFEPFRVVRPPLTDPLSGQVGAGALCTPSEPGYPQIVSADCTDLCRSASCQIAGCKDGGECGVTGRCDCSSDVECYTGLCDYDGTCVEDVGVCTCYGGPQAATYRCNGGACEATSPLPWNHTCAPARTILASTNSVARFWTSASPGHAASEVRFPSGPQSRFEGLGPPFAFYAEFNLDRHAGEGRALIESSTFNVSFTPNPNSTSSYGLSVRYLGASGAWRTFVAQGGASLLRAFQWYAVRVYVTDLEASRVILNVARYDAGYDWDDAWTAPQNFVGEPPVPFTGDVVVGGLSTDPAKRFSGRLDEFSAIRALPDPNLGSPQYFASWSGNAFGGTEAFCAGQGPPPPPVSGGASPCSYEGNVPPFGDNAQCGGQQTCWRGECRMRCDSRTPEPCSSGMSCRSVSAPVNADDAHLQVEICLPWSGGSPP